MSTTGGLHLLPLGQTGLRLICFNSSTQSGDKWAAKGSACLVSDLHFLKVSFFTRTVDFFTRVIVWEFLTSLLMGCLLVLYLLQRKSTLSGDRCDRYGVTFLSLKWKTPPLQHYSDNTGRNSKPLTEISSSFDLILLCCLVWVRYESSLPPAVTRHIHFRHQESHIHMVWYGTDFSHHMVFWYF